MKRLPILIGLAFLLALVASIGTAAAAPDATTVVVKPSSLNGWGFTTTNNAVGSFVAGPAGALGSGSAQHETKSSPGGKPQLATALFNGQKFADITSLTYRTYIQTYSTDPSGNILTHLLNIGLDLDGNSGTPADTVTMVYEPCYGANGCSAAIQPLNTWTTWNARATGQIWWATKAIAGTAFTVPFGSSSLSTRYWPPTPTPPSPSSPSTLAMAVAARRGTTSSAMWTR